MGEKTLKKARGLNSIADPSAFRGSKGRTTKIERTAEPEPETKPVQIHKPEPVAVIESPEPKVDKAPHRAVKPGTRRVRRELSIPLPVAEKLDQTGINPADVVMSAYRKYSDAIFSGEMGRMVSRGRKRLRLSISDQEFEQITRLADSRGWNRSETISVLLEAELQNDSVTIDLSEPHT